MKNHLQNRFKTLSFIALFLLTLTHAALAEKDKDEKSLLWKIEGKGMQTSYLFGTFHMMNQSDFELKEKVKTAFTESNQIVLELDMDEPGMQQEMMKHAGMKGDYSLKQLIEAPAYQQIDSVMKAKYKVGLAYFDKFKPFVISAMLVPTLMDEQIASYEQTFVQLAASQQKEILGLETVAEQMGIFDQVSYESQASDLVKVVSEKEEMKSLFQKMVSDYKKEDIAALYSLFTEYYENKEEIDMLLCKRNKNWVERMPEMAKEKMTFFAVGAGHLAGEEGVIALLREKGYTVTAVE